MSAATGEPAHSFHRPHPAPNTTFEPVSLTRPKLLSFCSSQGRRGAISDLRRPHHLESLKDNVDLIMEEEITPRRLPHEEGMRAGYV